MMSTFEWAGRSIVWRAVGDGPAVVLCHGTPFSSEVWRPYADALAADFTVYTLGVPYASLMLVDPVAIPPVGSPFFRFVEEHPTVLTELPDYIHDAVVRSYIRGASHPGFADGELAALAAPWLEEAGPAAFYHQIADFDEAYLEEIQRGCPAIDIPVQILWGEQDAWIGAEHGRRLAELIPGAGFELIPGAGHLVQHDAPVVLADRIRRWLGDGQGTATLR
jgi:pimeloyl-ACP methyl ester carboxylesterase